MQENFLESKTLIKEKKCAVHKFWNEDFSDPLALFSLVYTVHQCPFWQKSGIFPYLLQNFDLSFKCQISKPKQFPVTLNRSPSKEKSFTWSPSFNLNPGQIEQSLLPWCCMSAQSFLWSYWNLLIFYSLSFLTFNFFPIFIPASFPWYSATGKKWK